jgi:hypothetical protein
MSERMQSLLSRAVEDQLSEQRQLAGALGEVRAQLSQFGSQLEGLQGGGSPSPQVGEALGALAADVREAVRLLGERLDGLGRVVAERGHDLAEQRAAIGELKDSLDSHTSALGGMTGGLAALPAFGERIDALQGGLAGLGDRLRGLEELTAAVGALQQRADALDGGLRELRQAFTGVASRAAQLPGRDDIEAITGRVGDSVDGLGSRLGRLETAVPSLLERLDGLGDAQQSHLEALAALQQTLAERVDGGGTRGVDAAAVLGELQEIRAALEGRGVGAGDEGVAALAVQLDAVHDGLLGDDGLVAQVAALQDAEARPSGSTLDADTVGELVASAVAESERRLADHVDEAILTLAEALLRRRSARPRAAPSGLGAVLGSSEVASATAPSDDGETDDSADLADEPDLEDDVDGVDDEDADDEEAAPKVVAWQTPGPASALEEADDEAPAESSKRKPWWRPGG